jgi:hypothetical protein
LSILYISKSIIYIKLCVRLSCRLLIFYQQCVCHLDNYYKNVSFVSHFFIRIASCKHIRFTKWVIYPNSITTLYWRFNRGLIQGYCVPNCMKISLKWIRHNIIWAVSRQNKHTEYATSMDPDQPAQSDQDSCCSLSVSTLVIDSKRAAWILIRLRKNTSNYSKKRKMVGKHKNNVTLRVSDLLPLI